MNEKRDPKEIVRNGYDTISYRYRGDVEDESSQKYHAWLDELLPIIRASAGARLRILDLGCGCGVPVAKRLANDYDVTGVDLSPVQIERARRLVPRAQFLCQDISTLAFNPESFDAVVAFYSIIHVPVAEQPALLKEVYSWLRVGGLFMAILGRSDWTGTEDNWLEGGATMYWSHTGEETYLSWLSDAGFRIHWTRFIPEGDGGHVLVLAEKAADPAPH